AKQCLQQNVPLSELIQRTKKAACFSGTMRPNLIDMLDACGVQTARHLHSSRFFFSDAHHLLHTTSIIKYPVFVYGNNYTGYTPKIAQSTLLTKYAYTMFPKEIEQIKGDYLLVPLGKTVSEVIQTFIQQGKISK